MKEIIEHIKKISTISNLNYIDNGDVYQILNSGNISYCAAIIEPELSSYNGYNGNILEHSVRITVVDKLTEDESNLLDVFDNTRRILSDIVNDLINNDFWVNDSYNVNYIKQDFADKLAGVYATISIKETRFFCNYE